MAGVEKFDLIFLGAGLSSCLAAYRVLQSNPNLKLLILESKTLLHGEKTWSFHDTDFDDPKNYDWVRPFIDHEWHGYQVKFRDYERKFTSKYFSIRSPSLRIKMDKLLKQIVREDSEVSVVGDDFIQLRHGVRFEAKLILDGRGSIGQCSKECGFQKFTGLHVKTATKHGLASPIVMDATVKQADGYHFFYCLPFSDTEMLIEDTYYSNSPNMSRETNVKRINEYAESQGWQIKTILAEEFGCLPIPFFPDLNVENTSIGIAGGNFHVTTGYSIVKAIQFANWLAEEMKTATVSSEAVRDHLAKMWRSQSFLRRLNRMMFLAASPNERSGIFERFYTFGDGTIARFYSGNLLLKDKLRLVIGKPPVPIAKGIKYFFSAERGSALL